MTIDGIKEIIPLTNEIIVSQIIGGGSEFATMAFQLSRTLDGSP